MKKSQLSEEKQYVKKGLWKRITGLYATLKKENLPRLLLYVAIIILTGAALVFFSELIFHSNAFHDIFDSLWWTVVTITTVGYGDKVPQYPLGKILATVLMFLGVIITSLLSGTIASIFVDRKIREGKGLEDVNVKNHIVICGWNQNAENIIRSLVALKGSLKECLVLINEMDPEQFQSIKIKYPGIDLRFVRGDYTNENVLKRAAINYAKAALILLDTTGTSTLSNIDERTIIAVLAIKSLNNAIFTSAELANASNEQHLRRANVDDIIVNGEFNGFILASSTISPGVPLFLKELLSLKGKNSIKQIQCPSSYIGKKFRELSQYLSDTGKGILIGILSEEKKITLDDILSDDSSGIDAFIKRKFQEAEIDLLEEEKEEMKIKINPGADYIIKDTDWAFVISATE
ncbi:MAG: ion channel [Spirochaetia bacterium]